MSPPHSGAVVLVIDVLNDYLGRWEPNTRHRLTTSINSLLVWARAASVPIIWVRQEFESDLSDAFPEMRKKKIRITVRGTDGCQIVPELDRRPEDHEIVKKRYSAFFGTRLDGLLEELDTNRIILSGINTHACIRTAAIDAYQRDYEVVIPRECVASNDERHHEISLEYMNGKIADVMPLSRIIT